MSADGAAARLVRVTEVAPRDGLQNESTRVPTATKVEFIDRLAAAGFPEIEATSLVSAAWVPQLGDAADVMRSPAPLCRDRALNGGRSGLREWNHGAVGPAT